MTKITLGDAIEIRIAPVTLNAVSRQFVTPHFLGPIANEEHLINTNTKPLRVYKILLSSLFLFILILS